MTILGTIILGLASALTICSAQAPFDTLHIGNVVVRPSVTADFLALTTATETSNPLYKGLGLLHIVPAVTIDDAVSIRLRVVTESWQAFASTYNSAANSKLWAKPSLFARASVGGLLDSITMLVGDLWRIKNGQGLALDNFEAVGGTVALYSGAFKLEATNLGSGWTGTDRIQMLNLQYDNLIRINAFLNYSGTIGIYERSFDHLILSIDATTPSYAGFSGYAEAGYAIDQGIGAMAGIKYSYKNSETLIGIQAEGRAYQGDFFRNSFETLSFPYLVSLTSLDKPVNTYRSWIDEELGFYARLTAQQTIIGNLFVSTDTEFLSLNESIYTETCVGYAFTSAVAVKAGYLNKLFLLYGPATLLRPSSMFETSNQIVVKVTTRI